MPSVVAVTSLMMVYASEKGVRDPYLDLFIETATAMLEATAPPLPMPVASLPAFSPQLTDVKPTSAVDRDDGETWGRRGGDLEDDERITPRSAMPLTLPRGVGVMR